ncbi:PilZ domain-containing protein [Humisphaera borealis]|uniref:PilZ domain-containing protein n=1 Tax=Humisphaera borealis TaxID=2807512 RepID=A0A7M2WS87_9BACT|nr:PilZ domain-containing protein [Humisphaera borealis]QOV88144.1 PilZ domain-containing protein [Humisphaera borealis]
MLLLNQSSVESDELYIDEDGQERRRGLRVRENRPVKIYEPGTARYFGGQTEDISATGLRIELPAWAALRAGETLNIHVGLNGRGQTLTNRRSMLPARVVWVRRGQERSPMMEVGVEFLNNIGAHVHAA